MKADIHPQYHEVSFKCSCGNVVKSGSTLAKGDHLVDVCSKCHPFYTGKQKLVDTGGRIQKFRDKYSRKSSSQDASTDS